MTQAKEPRGLQRGLRSEQVPRGREEAQTKEQRSRPTALEVGQGEVGGLGKEAHQWVRVRQSGLEAG